MTTFAKNFSILVQTPSSSAPAPASAVGYNTKTFDGIGVGSSGPWFQTDLGGDSTRIVTNSDGTITLFPGANTTDGHSIDTAIFPGDGSFRGTGFGGGGYFRCEFSFTGTPPGPNPPYTPGPAFWANTIEMNSNPWGPATHWPGQATGYSDWIEVDVNEVNGGSGSMGSAIHNWYGIQQPNVTDVVQGATQTGLGDQSVIHSYAALWVPAAGGNQGYMEWYFDDVITPHSSRISWNAYNSALSPPPVAGSSAVSVLDTMHLYFILGSAPSNPMTVKSFQVWQKDSSNNVSAV